MLKTTFTGAALVLAAATSVSAGHLADKTYAQGAISSGDVAYRAVEQGTLHPGHVAVFATGEQEKYNKPAFDFHEDGTPYASGPGGYADTKKNANGLK